MATFRLQLMQVLILATGISSVGRMQLEQPQLLLRDRKTLFGGKQFWRLLERMAREFVKQVKDKGGVFLWRNTRLSFVIRGTRPRRLAFTGEKWKHLTTAKLTVSRNKHDLRRFFSDLDLFFGMKTVHSMQSFIFVSKTYAECSITCLSNLSNFISPFYHQSYQSNMWLWWMSCSLKWWKPNFSWQKGETRGGRALKLFNCITMQFSPSHKGTAAFIVCSRMTSCSLKQRAAKMLLLGHPAVWKTKYLIKKRFQEGKIFHPTRVLFWSRRRICRGSRKHHTIFCHWWSRLTARVVRLVKLLITLKMKNTIWKGKKLFKKESTFVWFIQRTKYRMMGLVRITSWYPNFNGSHFHSSPVKARLGISRRLSRIANDNFVFLQRNTHRVICWSDIACGSFRFGLVLSKLLPTTKLISDRMTWSCPGVSL